MNAVAQIDDPQREIAERVHQRLKFWGLWRWVEDDPGIGYPRVNLIGKYYRPELGDIWERSTVTDWAEAIVTDMAVAKLAVVAPRCWHAIRAKYYYCPEVADDIEIRQRDELRRYRSYSGKSISGTRFRALVSEGRKLVAMRLLT